VAAALVLARGSIVVVARTHRSALGEPVADPVDGEEVPRPVRLGLQLAADVLHVGVDGPLV
jgi:hypothetical protein